MAGNYSAAGKNLMLNAFAAAATHMSLHSADPGSTGANEISGGSPAYARKAVSWNSASAGSASASTTPTFDVPAGVTVAWAGLWTAVTGGTYLGKINIGSQSFGSQSTLPFASETIDLNAVASA